jgi:hypothetical protein
MVFNVTFNNISVISWQLVLLVEETGVPGEENVQVILHSLKIIEPRFGAEAHCF